MDNKKDIEFNASDSQETRPKGQALDVTSDSTTNIADEESKVSQRPTDTIKESTDTIKEPDYNYELGCMLGAFLGDALGSYVEFNPKPTNEQVEAALKMPGGGPWGLDPGQLTDDSELALSQAYGLIDGKGKLSLESIARYYAQWVNSPPFDIGQTTRNAFSKLWKKPSEHSNHAALCIDSSAKSNQGSQSNGGLMRMSPLAIWCSKLSESDLERAVKAELSLTHPNIGVHEAGITYCLAIKHLLANPGDMKGSFKEVEDYIVKRPSCTIRSWLTEVKEGNLPKANTKIGWVKIAWTYTMHYLRTEQKDYYAVMKEVLSKGGDTDTNACIVGAAIGAAVGLDNLPKEWVEKAKNLDVSLETARCKRGPWYNPRNVWKVVPELLKIRPTKLEFDDIEWSKYFS